MTTRAWLTPDNAPELEVITEDGAILYGNLAKILLGEAYKKGEKPPQGAGLTTRGFGQGRRR